MSEKLVRPIIQRDVNPSEILAILEQSLVDSFNGIKHINKCSVLFSGGVDSSLAALLTQRQCKDTLLITARCDNSHDAKAARKAADMMSIKLVEVRIDSESLWKDLPDIIKSINRSKRLDIEIAIPFFYAAREAKERGYETMISGQGPDELFGGYARYERMMIEKGPEEVEKALWRDVSITDAVNIQRDSLVMKYHGIKAIFPYLFPDFVHHALTIPATMNIAPKKKPARKLMFRQLALMMGVPEELTIEQKRATQYSSGTSKMLFETVRDHVEELITLSRRESQLRIQEILDGLSRQQSKVG